MTNSQKGALIGLLTAVTPAVFALAPWITPARAGAPPPAARRLPPQPTYSGPIGITRDDAFVFVANPDNDSVTMIEVLRDRNRVIREIPVGDTPRSVAVSPNGRQVFVTNQASGTVSVIDPRIGTVIREIPVGTEPFGCALTPDGSKLYVANMGSDSVTVIGTGSGRVVTTIPNVGPKPAAIAITTEQPARVYVTHFLAELRPDPRTVEQKEGRDNGKEGIVSVISAKTDRQLRVVRLIPIGDTGFKSNGSTLDRIPVRTNEGGGQIFDFTTGAFPNLLQSIVIKGSRAYVPNTGSSPNGPFRFNVNVQSLISVIDLSADRDPLITLNMNRGVQFEPVGQRLFPTNPTAIAFEHDEDYGWAVSGATNRLIRVQLGSNGAPTINAPTGSGQTSGIVRIPVGSNPQGIVINSTDTRAYVMNFISRNVSVVNLNDESPGEMTRIQTAGLPETGTLDAIIHRGNELFNTSIGPAGTNDNAKSPAGRMSDFGWGSCFNCHPFGLADGVTWMFPDGPRQTISMESTFAHPQPDGALSNSNGAPLLPSSNQRVLNWSAVRDEVQDFELNVRGVSGGQGLIFDSGGTQDPCVFNLFLPSGSSCPPEKATNTGRSADLDAIAAYIAFGIRAPNAPLRIANVERGRELFSEVGCTSCHGGANWTSSRVTFTPPPGVTVTAGQIIYPLRGVGTFNSEAPNELRANQTSVIVANGTLGINPPSLLSVSAGAPFFHSGSAGTLEEVLNHVGHRSAGTGGSDRLTDPRDRRQLIRFLHSIDSITPTFP